ncbi:hypothetical protein DFQ28_009978 [Apophysomyces sp. BC1034]|nr:hypothetical protein DFQ28_009978 [Apophysomyces sp. BC1034]
MAQHRPLATRATPLRTIRIPPLPLFMIGIGFACLGVGLYSHFTSDIQKYPPPIRQALRKALYYAQPGKDVTLAIQYFREALDLALESNEMERDGAPLTGIMIQMGVVYESLGRFPEARQVLSLALHHLLRLESTGDVFDTELESFTAQTQRKVVGIAQKLGDIAEAMHQDEEAEKWYTWSVEHLLKISSRPISEYGDSDQVVFDEEHMPEWLTHTEVGAALESLGSFYATRKNYSFAIPLYLRALSLAGLQSCQSAVLMNNLSEAYAGINQFEDAKQWAQKGLDLAQNPNTRKQTNDKAKATRFYEQARNHGREFKLFSCIKEADRALRRIAQEKEAPTSLE